MRARRIAILCALLLPFGGPAAARGMARIPTSDELLAKSTLVCNGRVLDTICSGPNVVNVYAGGISQGYPETWMSAHVRVLHVFKGGAPAEIVVRYRVAQPNLLLGDGPLHMRLAAGERYRFFLKPASRPGEFVSVLDGLIDDGFALQTLCPDESDESPAMSNDEAIRIALDYLRTKRPGVRYDSEHAGVVPQTMSDRVSFWTSMNADSDRATVVVRRNRTIDAISSRLESP